MFSRITLHYSLTWEDLLQVDKQQNYLFRRFIFGTLRVCYCLPKFVSDWSKTWCQMPDVSMSMPVWVLPLWHENFSPRHLLSQKEWWARDQQKGLHWRHIQAGPRQLQGYRRKNWGRAERKKCFSNHRFLYVHSQWISNTIIMCSTSNSDKWSGRGRPRFMLRQKNLETGMAMQLFNFPIHETHQYTGILIFLTESRTTYFPGLCKFCGNT